MMFRNAKSWSFVFQEARRKFIGLVTAMKCDLCGLLVQDTTHNDNIVP
jgi:hypothetical protein